MSVTTPTPALWPHPPQLCSKLLQFSEAELAIVVSVNGVEDKANLGEVVLTDTVQDGPVREGERTQSYSVLLYMYM